MSRNNETNPHFARPPLGTDQDHAQHPPDNLHAPTPPWRTQPRPEGQSQPRGQRRSRKNRPDKQTQPLRADPQPAPSPLAPHRDHPDDQYYQPHSSVGLYPRHHDDQTQPPSSTVQQPRHQEDHDPKTHGSAVPFPRGDEDHPRPDQQKPHGSLVPSTQHQDQTRLPHGSPATPVSQHNGDQRSRREQRHPHVPWMPPASPTKPFTWLTAIFCAIFWIMVILGGLIVLIVYLVFRPRSPRFEVSHATLNAAYLDMGYLLNADLTMLANFTNPNRKVSVDFSYMYVELHYGRTLIATQTIAPFSAPKAKTRLADLHMITSQVRLSELEIQRLKRQTMNNGVIFEVKGFFRARSNFGGLLRYSYWLHGECTIMVRRPPDGTMAAKKCKTKH